MYFRKSMATVQNPQKALVINSVKRTDELDRHFNKFSRILTSNPLNNPLPLGSTEIENITFDATGIRNKFWDNTRKQNPLSQKTTVLPKKTKKNKKK